MIIGRYDTYFTINELSEMTGVTAKTVMNWLSEGVIQAVKLGRRRFVPLSSIEEAFGHRSDDKIPIMAELEKQINLVRRDVRGSRIEKLNKG